MENRNRSFFSRIRANWRIKSVDGHKINIEYVIRYTHVLCSSLYVTVLLLLLFVVFHSTSLNVN